MSWKTAKLGEISTVSSSKRIFARQYTNKGVPFYRQKEIIDKKNKVELTDILYISQETYDEIKAKFGAPKKGDLLITAVGVTLGIPYVVDDETFYFKDGNLIWLRDFDESADSKFVYYWITSETGKKAMWSRTIGSAQPALTIDTIKQFEIPYPPIETQHRIASILSAYDDLIENNQKQIKFLEEAAQRLYKEWFVDLRFPNYENTPVVDGVPEGWRIGRLDELGEFKRGKTITKDSVISGNVPVVAGGLEPAYFHNTANTVAPIITVSGSGANAGFTRMYHVNVWASDCSFVDSNTTEYLYLVYCYLKANKADLDRLQKGAAQPHVYAKDINAMTIMIANKELLLRFNETVSPTFTKIGNLFQQIEKLKEARDRLLPKLMSGELEV